MAMYNLFVVLLICLSQCQGHTEMDRGSHLRSVMLNDKVAFLSNKMKALQEQVGQLNKEITEYRDSQQKADVTAAFSAYMTVGTFQPSTAVVIPFDGVAINLGGYYNNTDYAFRCPVTGLYLFTVTLNSGEIDFSGDDKVYAELRMSGNHVAELYSFNGVFAETLILQPSNTVLLECSSGDTVYVSTISSSYNQVYGAEFSRRSTFSGFLLTAT